MCGKTILAGGTRLRRIPISVKIPTWAPEAKAVIQSLIGTKLNNRIKRTITTIVVIEKNSIGVSPLLFILFNYNNI